MKNKKIIIISSIFLIFIVVLTIYFTLNININKNKNRIFIDGELAITDEKTFDYKYKENFNDYFFVIKDGKLGAINSNGDIVIDFIYSKDSYIISNSDLVTINSNDMYYLYDKNLNLIESSIDTINIIKDPIDNQMYYYIDNTIYNLKKEKIYTGTYDYFMKCKDYVITNSEIINIKNNDKIMINFFDENKDIIYAISRDEKILYLYDSLNNKFNSYEIINMYPTGYSVKDSDKTYSFSRNYGLISSDSKIDLNDYKLDFSSCTFGFKVLDKDNKLISDECFYDYYKDNMVKEIYLTKDQDNYILYNNKIIDNKYSLSIEGDYITSFDQEKSILKLYDLEGNEIKNNICYFFIDYRDNNTYICDDGSSNFIVDNNFNKISEDYDNLFCIPNSRYCIYNVNKEYGVLFDNDNLIDNIYSNIILSYDNKKIIAQNLWGFDVFYLNEVSDDNYLTKDELNIEIPKPYNTINIDEVITEYNLNNIKDKIYENEELFKKYAYIVLNNNNLGIYKDKVMNLFYLVVQNKNYMEENYFFESLMQLNIEKKDVLEDLESIGLYYDNSKKIELSTDEDNVLYHELTHFVDFSFSSNFSNSIFKCNNKYYSNYDYNKLNALEMNTCEMVIDEEPNFILEGGAEYYSSYYLNNKALRTYNIQTKIIGALSYIYGYDKLNQVFFDGVNGYYELFMLFNESGISVEDYNKFLSITDRHHTILQEEMFYITDILIKMYESKNDKKWYEDKEFSEIISFIIGYNEVMEAYTPRYNEYKKLDYNFIEKYENVISSYNWSSMPFDYMKTNDGSYLVFRFYDDNYNTFYRVVKYDFENDKILEEITVNS